MDPVWGEIAKYASYAIIAYPVCKYIIGPIFGANSAKIIKEAAKVYEEYNKAYTKTIEERAKVTMELTKIGKSKEEISDILNVSLPLPKETDIEI